MFNSKIFNYGCAFKAMRLLIRPEQNMLERVTVAGSNLVESRKASYIALGDNTVQTVKDFMSSWENTFRKWNISEPHESITHILAHVLKTKRVNDVLKLQNTTLTRDEIIKINHFCKKRLERMPVQYIIEEWDFRYLTLKLRPPTFIPRPETEQLVEIVLNEVKNNIVKILEPCCGSGAISLSLLHELKDAKCVAFDKSKHAYDLTIENATNLNLDLKVFNLSVGDIKLVLNEKFDVIVSNPPYIPSDEISNLQPEILKYENLDALDGGENGLNIIKQIFTLGSEFLNPQGKIFLEVNPTHPVLIKSFLSEHVTLGLRFLRSYKDFNENERFVEIIKD